MFYESFMVIVFEESESDPIAPLRSREKDSSRAHGDGHGYKGGFYGYKGWFLWQCECIGCN